MAHADAYLDCMPASRAHGSPLKPFRLRMSLQHGVSGLCHLGLFNKMSWQLYWSSRLEAPRTVPGTYLTSLNFDKVSPYHHSLGVSVRKAGWGGEKGSLLWDWLVDLSSCTWRHHRKQPLKYTDFA